MRLNSININLLVLSVLLLLTCRVSYAGGLKPEAGFIDRKLCIECHEEQYKMWKGSHHDLAMDVATEETVIGDFNNAEFTQHGVTSTFYKKDGKFFVRTDGRDGKLHDYEITYVFGVDPLQQYMIKFPDGRIQMPDIGWDDHPKEEGGQRWFHIHPDDDITPDHIFHWTRRFLNWNYMCAECHTTNLLKNYDLKTKTFDTTWTMINVGCQGCHGPGSGHLEWADSDKKTESDNKGLQINMRADDPDVQIGACARCHSRRNGLRKDYQYGIPFMDQYVPQVLTDLFYYPDGQILDEVYVYGSLLQSKKYQKGVRCTDCHNPHTARLRADGNELCNRCHSVSPLQKFAWMKQKNYDTKEHHFHKNGSTGADCADCHIPETNYMVVDPRRDHKFQIPRPDLSVKLGIPNPCNMCHKDKSSEWAAAAVDEWYPDTKEERSKETRAEIFAAAQAGKPEAVPGLIRTIKDLSIPPIIRATALNILSQFRNMDALEATASALKDEDPFVRYEAVKGISNLMPKVLGTEYQKRKHSLIVPLLNDPLRAVRSEAARVLTEIPAELIKGQERKEFEKALDEFIQRQESVADRPESHLNLGIMYENLGQDDKAESSYKTSLRIVDDFYPASFNLANLYNRLGRNEEAEQQFKKIIEFNTEDGDAYYSLGLLYAEMGRSEESAASLGKAVELIPDRARMRYNYSLALRQIGRNEDSLAEMLRAYETDPQDAQIVNTLAIFYIQTGKWRKALPYAEKLVEMLPGEKGPEEMLMQIRQVISAVKER
jgi:predicted CXXCH cytochrome family protein